MQPVCSFIEQSNGQPQQAGGQPRSDTPSTDPSAAEAAQQSVQLPQKFVMGWSTSSMLANSIKKCPRAVRSEMFNSLARIMLMVRLTNQSREDFTQQVKDAIQTFYDTFKDQQEFVAYFHHWGHKFGELRVLDEIYVYNH
ncbi:TPA: hypothetical protein ACH3X1_009273 [Trebouxia sp. C0004]